MKFQSARKARPLPSHDPVHIAKIVIINFALQNTLIADPISASMPLGLNHHKVTYDGYQTRGLIYIALSIPWIAYTHGILTGEGVDTLLFLDSAVERMLTKLLGMKAKRNCKTA